MAIGLKQILSVINIIAGGLLIGLGIYQYTKIDIQWKQPSTIFNPFFTILFGLLLMLAEFRIEFVKQYFVFLNNFFGRGVFCIYLSGIASATISDAIDSTFGYVASFTILAIGIIYIGMHFFVKHDEDDDKDKPLLEKSDKVSNLSDKTYEQNQSNVQSKPVDAEDNLSQPIRAEDD